MGNADGFDRAELLEVFNREQIEGLSCDYDADNQRNGNRDAKVHWDARVLQIIADAVPAKLTACPRAQAGLSFDAAAEFPRVNSELRAHQHIGELRALAPDEIHRLAVARVHDGPTHERRGGVRNANDVGFVVIEFDRAVKLERLTGKQQDVAGVINHHRVRLAQPLPRAKQHLARCAGERGVVQAEAERDGKLAVERARDRAALEKFHRPFNAVHAAHACEVGVLERLGLLEIFRLRVHHPNLRVADVGNLTAGALENA